MRYKQQSNLPLEKLNNYSQAIKYACNLKWYVESNSENAVGNIYGDACM